MIISKFGSPLETHRGVRGERGVGFDLTSDGDYDMKTKRLRNVGDPEAANDAITLAHLKKSLTLFENKTTSAFENLAKKLDDHLKDIPFDITPDGDLSLKYKTVVGENGVEIQEKRKVKNIGYPTHSEDSTHRKFVVDAIKRKFDELPFKITSDGDVKFTDLEVENIDGTKRVRKRKLLNIRGVLNEIVDNSNESVVTNHGASSE